MFNGFSQSGAELERLNAALALLRMSAWVSTFLKSANRELFSLLPVELSVGEVAVCAAIGCADKTSETNQTDAIPAILDELVCKACSSTRICKSAEPWPPNRPPFCLYPS